MALTDRTKQYLRLDPKKSYHLNRAQKAAGNTLIAGTSVEWDIGQEESSRVALDIDEAAWDLDILNAKVDTLHIINIKKTIAPDSVITIQGTGYKFVNMSDKAAPAASIEITLSSDADLFFEVSLNVTSRRDDGDLIVQVLSI